MVDLMQLDRLSGASVREKSELSVSVILDCPKPGPRTLNQVASFEAAGCEIVVASDEPWQQAPPAVRVVSVRTLSRGDKLDKAAEVATGDLLVFLDDATDLEKGWQAAVREIFNDPAIGAAGGPRILPEGATHRQRATWGLLTSRLGSGSLFYRFEYSNRRRVAELPVTNLVVRRSAFEAVGGFQSPSPLGDDSRLCFKLRSLLKLDIVYDPRLAVLAVPPEFPRPFLSLVYKWGRQRGDLSRRLPETAPLLPYVLPSALFSALLAMVLMAPFANIARLGILGAALAYLLAGLTMVYRAKDLRIGVLQAMGLPAVHLAYGWGYVRGFLGRALGDVVPGRGARRKQLRILIFNWRDITHPWSGGAEAYMHEMARRWVAEGNEVGWVCERYRSGRRIETIDGIRFHRVGGRYTVYFFAAALYIWRLRNRYDFIVDCENGIPFFTPLFSRKPSTLVIFHLHSEVFRRELSKSISWLALWLENWLMPRVYGQKRLVTISPSTLRELAARHYEPSRISVVTPGVDLPQNPAPKCESQDPLIVCTGRLKAYKSVDLLLRAMPDVLSTFPTSKLAIVGQGPERVRLERLAWKLGLARAVRFYGYVDKPTRDELMSRAWVAVCPSAFEGWGVVCLEAGAAMTPVIASDVAGLRDAVVDGSTGTLVSYGDISALSSAISTLLSSPQMRSAMGKAGHVWASDHKWAPAAKLFLRSVTGELEIGGESPKPAWRAAADLAAATREGAQAD